MDTLRLTDRLTLLRFPVGQAYLWSDPDGLTLIDTGTAGSGPDIAEAVRASGRRPEEIRLVVLTHFHQDHAGGAAEMVSLAPRSRVVAHRLEAPIVRGHAAGPAPVFTDAPEFERRLWAELPSLPPAPPAPVHREVTDGDVLAFGGGAVVVGAAGHTPGSIAVHLPSHDLLFTGDTVAGTESGPIPGVFNVDRPRALRSVRRLAALRAGTVCFGHGDPLTDGTPLDVALGSPT
ncbi:MBL fold metallo-hydrolase [Streptomyces durbertensis]|uniref:MBL fold metallo-hydrolase n=1 Tax=Streptomyces durbertensis TaxID=2448886 RepID=A0ABR6EEZ7_9ACTN|nr:MBL fold metallo-hydrolase [Streptomyces durbertensis]MBB1243044.1 MBL fold metallo-hydrolase [Streptomyces durbertensis]